MNQIYLDTARLLTQIAPLSFAAIDSPFIMEKKRIQFCVANTYFYVYDS